MSDMPKDMIEAFERAQKYGYAEVSLSLSMKRDKSCIENTTPTVIDRLRTRGTPIELIASYLLADDANDASAAFRTSVLEAAYERIKEAFTNVNVSFETSRVLTDMKPARKAVTLGALDFFEDLQLSPEFDECLLKQGALVGYATKHQICPDTILTKVTDTLNATVLRCIETFSNTIQPAVVNAVTNSTSVNQQGGYYTFSIITDLSTAVIALIENMSQIRAEATLHLYGYFHRPAS